MAEYARCFDVSALSPVQATEVIGLCARIEASAASIKALAAARIAECKSWQAAGYRSAADQLADQAGMSPTNAKRTLLAGQRMADQPQVARAALAGDLSAEQASAVADGVAADPSKAAELIEAARQSSLPELNEAVAGIKAAVADADQRWRQVHEQRSLRRWTDRDGVMQVHGAGHPEDGPRLWRMLDPVRRRLNMLRLNAGQPHDTFDALDYDALMAIADIAIGKDSGELGWADLVELGLFPQAGATQPASGAERRTKKLAGSPLRIMIRVDLDALLRGVARDGDLCEIPGYGPVPVSVVEDLLATENPFIIGILTKGQALSGVYHHGRHPNAYQRSALDFLQPTCAVQGCSARAGLQYDHRVDWARTKITAFDLLDRLCPHHHRQKTRHNWALVDGRGKRAFVPPDDPRHPRYIHHPP